MFVTTLHRLFHTLTDFHELDNVAREVVVWVVLARNNSFPSKLLGLQ